MKNVTNCRLSLSQMNSIFEMGENASAKQFVPYVFQHGSTHLDAHVSFWCGVPCQQSVWFVVVVVGWFFDFTKNQNCGIDPHGWSTPYHWWDLSTVQCQLGPNIIHKSRLMNLLPEGSLPGDLFMWLILALWHEVCDEEVHQWTCCLPCQATREQSKIITWEWVSWKHLLKFLWCLAL